MRVDLPAPFSPTMAWTSPRRTSKLTSSRAVTPPKCFERPLSWMSGSVGIRPDSVFVLRHRLSGGVQVAEVFRHIARIPFRLLLWIGLTSVKSVHVLPSDHFGSHVYPAVWDGLPGPQVAREGENGEITLQIRMLPNDHLNCARAQGIKCLSAQIVTADQPLPFRAHLQPGHVRQVHRAKPDHCDHVRIGSREIFPRAIVRRVFRIHIERFADLEP